ncbi:hypothetical protein OBBRIDRAFT_712224, partial [Obba rivulosa]
PQLPPPVAHKVWILDCKSCGTFLTNRGMRAVLLLRPNVPLFSTDALPINCSASSADTTPTSSAHRPYMISNAQATPSSSPELQTRIPARTCECLTQTLCCHGCGNSVGYMIVVPCYRCTSSITANNRTTNGHRFVFYSSEITAGERHHIPGERGVLPHKPRTGHNITSPEAVDPEMPPLEPIPGISPSPTSVSPAMVPTGSDSADLRDAPRPSHVEPRFSRTHLAFPPTGAAPTSSPPRPRASAAPLVSAGTQAPGAAPHDPPPEPLKAGEVLYWHNLVRSGEIPAVCEDQRAR